MGGDVDELSSLLIRLQASPQDAEVRQAAAEALDAAGRIDDAATVLAPLINLTGHDADVGLPCLCKLCLPGAGVAAESAGMQFSRSFAVVGTRVLHFWMLTELEHERTGVRASVTAALRDRLAKQPGVKR
ncbi:MAG: tetratricopeptide repeat protein [Myxococcota bacterium]|nr:tetratricopeptide repeat protein [Myxococcota bacterium]